MNLMNYTISKKKTGVALLGIAILILFIPIPVSYSQSPQPLPGGVNCASIFSAASTLPLLYLPEFSVGSTSDTLQANVTLSGLQYVQGQQNSTFKLAGAFGSIHNLTTGKQVATFRASGIYIAWRNGTSAGLPHSVIFGVSIAQVYLDVTPSIQKKLSLPIDYFTLQGFGATIIINCASNTYSVQSSATTSIISMVQGKLPSIFSWSST
ncbi:MAG: hypothetical protein KGI38_11730 [Thaumarchaeota archaeon]|nr:hypothetical protein [Nitrososphaerota archaeon]